MNQELTTIEKEIVNIAEQRYIESGYMYEGHIAPNMSVIIKLCKDPFKVLCNLIEKNILIKRDCHAISFALVKSRRLELIREHDLSNVWQKKASCFYPNSLECGEIPKVLICEKHSLHKEIIDAVLKMEKIEKHQKDFMEKYNAIITTCGVGQIPEVGHRTLEKDEKLYFRFHHRKGIHN